ncbi:MAG TPA: prepilin-type N-terminal cleavage/methylation domain-containing protein [Gammaproteobacteria bacterium]|nr:prepilin-type N-terminal cleavage/methylation domain-containing protein [Gammaproteobacteria bacterium]
MDRNTNRGFTLMELMIVLAIIGILAAIAYPSYQSQTQKTRRSDGQTALLRAVQQMERYYTENNSYAGAVAGTTFQTASDEGFYTLSFQAGPTASTYTLQAVPGAAQAGDPCGTLTINQANQKLPANCW